MVFNCGFCKFDTDAAATCKHCYWDKESKYWSTESYALMVDLFSAAFNLVREINISLI